MKRELVASALARWGMLDGLLSARKRLKVPLLTVLTYHRVAAPNVVGELDPGTLDADSVTFSEQLDFLQKHFAIIGVRDVLRSGAKRLPPNPLLLTFDDGYRDNFEVVFPILKKRSLPATFFIATSYPDSGRLYWWDKIALLVRRSRAASVELSSPKLVINPTADPDGARRALLRRAKRTPGIDPDRFVDSVARALGVALEPDEERELARRTIMSWEEVRTLRSEGMDVESHSHGHRVFSTMSDQELARDLRTSRELLFAKVGRWPRALAYPTGVPPLRRHRDITAQAGFSLAFTNETGIAETWRLDPYAVPRVAVESWMPKDLFRAFVALPYLSTYARAA